MVAPGVTPNVLSIDVEEWFHIMDVPSTPEPDAWSDLEGRVERNVALLLDELDAAGVTATLFVLGWVAEQYPKLVHHAHERGHEIASHGSRHQLVYKQTPKVFQADISDAKHCLEDIIGAPVRGYRAPGFSVTEATPWALECVAAAGYEYDSSIFPASRGHGGMRGGEIAPHVVETPSGPLKEFPITVVDWYGQRVCLFGGGYFRLFPYWAIRSAARRVAREGRPVIYYLHPREIDPDHPRLPMPLVRRTKSYVNLRGTLPKFRRLLRDAPLVPFRDWMPYFDGGS